MSCRYYRQLAKLYYFFSISFKLFRKKKKKTENGGQTPFPACSCIGENFGEHDKAVSQSVFCSGKTGKRVFVCSSPQKATKITRDSNFNWVSILSNVSVWKEATIIGWTRHVVNLTWAVATPKCMHFDLLVRIRINKLMFKRLPNQSAVHVQLVTITIRRVLFFYLPDSTFHRI